VLRYLSSPRQKRMGSCRADSEVRPATCSQVKSLGCTGRRTSDQRAGDSGSGRMAVATLGNFWAESAAADPLLPGTGFARGARGLALKRRAYSAVMSRYFWANSSEGSISLPSYHSFQEVTSTQCGSAAMASSHCTWYKAPSRRSARRPGLRIFVSSYPGITVSVLIRVWASAVRTQAGYAVLAQARASGADLPLSEPTVL